MKSASQVRKKLSQVIYRRFQREVRTSLSLRPENCIHNRLVVLPTGSVRVCGISPDSLPTCDEGLGGLEQVRSCPYFSCGETKESVKARFTAILSAGSDRIAESYPDVAALMWVLADEPSPPTEGEELPVPLSDPEPEPLPEYRRLVLDGGTAPALTVVFPWR